MFVSSKAITHNIDRGRIVCNEHLRALNSVALLIKSRFDDDVELNGRLCSRWAISSVNMLLFVFRRSEIISDHLSILHDEPDPLELGDVGDRR